MRSISRFLTVLAIVAAIVPPWQTSRPVAASPGDQIGDVTVAEGENTTGVGVAFDGQYLYYSTGFRSGTTLHRMTPDGRNHADVAVRDDISDAPVPVDAMAYDQGRARLWVGSGSQVYLVHPTTGKASYRFTASSCGLRDGLAYDATDDSIWESCDASVVVYHWRADGQSLGNFRLDSGIGDMQPQCSPYSSGIAVGGNLLYLGAGGCSYYFTYSKSGQKLQAFSYSGQRAEGITCDATTFKGRGKEVMWVRDAYDGHIRAFEVPSGTCGTAGAPPKPRRAVIYVGGMASYNTCSPDAKSVASGVPKWGTPYLQTEAWIQQNVTVSDIAYFSYLGYCDGGTGENGALPDYQGYNTCSSIDTTYYPRLKGLIERITDKAPGMQVTMVAHSQGGLIATYTVGRLLKDDPAFVRQRIASVITFDSFPEGFNTGEQALAPIFGTPLREACGFSSPAKTDWGWEGEVAKTARTATQEVNGYRVRFYTLGGTALFGAIGGNAVTEPFTHISGEVLHEQIPGVDHGESWQKELERTKELVGCAVIRALSCTFFKAKVDPNQPVPVPVPVPTGAPQVRFIAGWQGSTVSLTLVTPSGTRLNPFNLPAGVSHEVGRNFDSYTVQNPQPGTWTLELFGVDVPAGGEDVTVLTDAPLPTYNLSLTATGGGTATASPSVGLVTADTVVRLTAFPVPGYIFTGWVGGGTSLGWSNPLLLTMSANHVVQATFAPMKGFPDVPSSRADYSAITELASRGTIRGYTSGNYGPDDKVQRAQMAALISRAMPLGPGMPTGGVLTPPACLEAGSWDCEDWGNDFTDPGGIDPNLWRNAGTLQHYAVTLGYTAADCAVKGKVAPCYGPTDPVTYAQTIAFLTRAMKAKGYWVDQPRVAHPYTGVPAAHDLDVRTFFFYTQGLGGVPTLPPGKGWNGEATRGWFAMALWTAIDSYWSTLRTP